MPLTCYCDFDGDYSWWYENPDDYEEVPKPNRIYPPVKRHKCSSCNKLIAYGSLGARFQRWRNPVSDVEREIYQDDWGEVELADMWLCEECADLWFSFNELGFECVSPEENMLELAKEYGAMSRTIRAHHTPKYFTYKEA